MTAITKFNYLSKDFLTLRDELFRRIPILTKGAVTDFNESDPGITILELFLSACDNLMYYLDMQGNELYLQTARQRDSVIRLLKLIGYTVQGYRAATGQVAFTIAPNQYPAYPVTIPNGITCTGGSVNGTSIIFTVTDDDSYIYSSNRTKIVNIKQGVYVTDTFISTGNPDQRLKLTGSRCDKSTVEVYVGNNEEWTQVSTFYYSNSDSLHFKTDIDEDSIIYVQFGDGQFGNIPTYNSTITVRYIQTDGVLGNVGKQAITSISANTITDANGKGVNVSVVNATATSGGDDPETIERAKETATALLFAMYRALSRGDFVTLMLSIPGIERAIAWGENEEENPDYKLMNRVRVSFFSSEFFDMYYNPVSRSKYRHVRDNLIKPLLLQRMPITTKLTFIDPLLIDIFVSLHVGIDTNLYDPSLIIDDVRYALATEYNLDKITFGQDIRISNILKIVNNVTGVSWAQVTRLSTYPIQNPDLAPNPPIDIILEKWKLPNLIDYTYNLNIPVRIPSPPYLEVDLTIQTFQEVGTYDVTVTNPDEQYDIYNQGYTILPSANLPHIDITYSDITDEPTPTGGYYGNPNPEADCPTVFSSVS